MFEIKDIIILQLFLRIYVLVYNMDGDGAASIVRIVDINMDDELVTSSSDVELDESDDDLLLSDEPGIIVNNSDSDNEEAELIA